MVSDNGKWKCFQTPPKDQLSRLGDKAYSAWYAKLDQEAEALVAAVFQENKAAATPEIAVYLKEAVGNSTRIDYGTKETCVLSHHKAAFVVFFCCLCKITTLKVDDQLAIIFKVFDSQLGSQYIA
ncbi:serine/threonine-protein phosphatase 2A activator-like [Salmo trutta]|uniref:serine/threonine-protein phosphatase 2A activator-like n=1 Tax=Salmo trutta TaxID=8032 RepID=UPI0011316ABF|nr:serine/threonine-protein phosphatase 2A activator-like [Salmo trutta]